MGAVAARSTLAHSCVMKNGATGHLVLSCVVGAMPTAQQRRFDGRVIVAPATATIATGVGLVDVLGMFWSSSMAPDVYPLRQPRTGLRSDRCGHRPASSGIAVGASCYATEFLCSSRFSTYSHNI